MKADFEEMLGLIGDVVSEGLKRTPAEIYAIPTERWAETSATHLENWPQALHEISIRSVGTCLPEKVARVLGSCMAEFGEGFDVSDVPESEQKMLYDDLLGRLDAVLKGWPSGGFIRLGSRSPKDAWLLHRPDLRKGQVFSGADALVRLTACSERIYEDLQTSLAMKSEPWIWLREWVSMEPWQEFRCFMQNRQLTGISQYDYHQGRLEQVVENSEAIAQAIRAFFETTFLPAIHLENVIFDVIVTPDGDKWDVKLLEINPYGWLTDPCLFSWREPESFDGSIKFCTEPARRHATLADLDEDEAVEEQD